ncbi:TPA: EAL domain-containing protein [Burkholderia aenigmatica]|uniref:EAL domain-containing protein n=1 Tax=Burkholderia sp. AU45251 TaxID=3059204 RepID=UPI00264EE616|nr:EAL domain-containing protein [Burkholderia sp. AU45251]HDR9482184.1 EAL domain-containing protein [Burkholderia aenigmatica]MDN7515180.1 EAL domain-containing protein [Burkholderia sp. AU45251]HDR9515651.1 EAL domain-containing protein [Burkholderia aenigmatica]HDR9590555.1 EAL domain-containing protein [Burkholderia aenigmatica]HDR9598928.1 EAL domain-containing protein [Burkholderia aenigmatica]
MFSFGHCLAVQNSPPPDSDIRIAHHHSLPGPTSGEIDQGLASNAFSPYYQPIFRLLDGCICGAEVLARWPHPRLGLLTPVSFLPLLEAHRHADALLARLFARMFEQGLALQQELMMRRAPPVRLAFNVQLGQIAGATFVDDIREALAKTGLPAAGLTFEVIESGPGLAPAQLAPLLANMERLRSMGCGLAMDDLGQGHSSLARLCRYPFSQLKLDAVFVRALDHSSTSRAVVRAALSLARELGIELVAEGIETDTQRRCLIDMGCEVGQGFLLAPPLPHDKLVAHLRRDDTTALSASLLAS